MSQWNEWSVFIFQRKPFSYLVHYLAWIVADQTKWSNMPVGENLFMKSTVQFIFLSVWLCVCLHQQHSDVGSCCAPTVFVLQILSLSKMVLRLRLYCLCLYHVYFNTVFKGAYANTQFDVGSQIIFFLYPNTAKNIAALTYVFFDTSKVVIDLKTDCTVFHIVSI